MNTRDALLSGKKIVEKFCDSKIVHSYYVEFGRRLEILKLVEEHCKQGSAVFGSRCTTFHNLLCS